MNAKKPATRERATGLGLKGEKGEMGGEISSAEQRAEGLLR